MTATVWWPIIRFAKKVPEAFDLLPTGYTLRRLAAKCAMHATSKLADFVGPVRLGVGVSEGCELIHANASSSQCRLILSSQN